jgi:hypothetical protein
MPMTVISTSAPSVAAPVQPCPRSGKRAPPDAHHAVSDDKQQQDEGVQQVRRHPHRPRIRDIGRHTLKQHQPRAHQRFGNHENHAQHRAQPHDVLARIRPKRPNQHRQHQQERQPTGQAVAELDEGLDGGVARDNLPVAGRPMAAAARA